MITEIFYGLLFFACLFLILYLWRKDPEYPVLAWVSASLFFILGGGLILSGLSVETGSLSYSISEVQENQTLNFPVSTNTTIEKTYTPVSNLSTIPLGLLFILLGIYLALNPFDLERKKKRREHEENDVELKGI